jgi:hypothetical protein
MLGLKRNQFANPLRRLDSKQLPSASNISPSSPVFSLCDAHDGN